MSESPIFELDTLYVDVNVYAGSDIPKAIYQMVQLAKRTGLGVWAKMNGVRVLARPSDDAQMITLAWHEAIKNKRDIASA